VSDPSEESNAGEPARERFLDGSHPANMTRLEMADCSYKLRCMYRDQIECKNLTVGMQIIVSKLTERW
jgi:hypothetical protein